MVATSRARIGCLGIDGSPGSHAPMNAPVAKAIEPVAKAIKPVAKAKKAVVKAFCRIIGMTACISSLVNFSGPSICFAQAVVSPDTMPIPIARDAESRLASGLRPTESEQRMLEEIQQGCFQFFWHEIGSPACLVKDRRKADVCSIAAVGFQLASLPIGVEHHWISRQDGEARAHTILSALLRRDDNRKYGVFLHFVDQNTGGLKAGSPELQTSTVDHALFLAGALTAASYFGDDVAALVDRLVTETDWKQYVRDSGGLVSFGWVPKNPHDLTGEGTFKTLTWQWASDEERILYFLATGTPVEKHRVPAATYYKLQRRYMQHEDMPPFVASWNSALFTYFFSHCWIDFRHYGVESPEEFGVDLPPVDWFENTRRATLTLRTRCIQESGRFKSLSENRWGPSPCMAFNNDGTETYAVPELRPNIADHDVWCNGTVAPYAAASVLSMTPRESLAALYEMRHLRLPSGESIWEDPSQGGYGFADSFNLDQGRAQFDLVGIDVGPMLVAIENYRTGLIWNLFHQHPVAIRAVEALKLGATFVDRSADQP